MLGRKEGAELLAENRLVGEQSEQRAQPAPEQSLRWREAGALKDDAAVEQQRPGQLKVQVPLEIARHQLGGNGRAHVMGDDEDGAGRLTTLQEILDQVGLPEKAVGVTAWLR